MQAGLAAQATSNTHRADAAAVSRAVGFSPALSSEGAGWKHAALYAWRGPCEFAHFKPLCEPVLVYHTGGAPIIDVRHDHGRRERSRPGLLTLVPAGTPVDWYIAGDVHSYSLHLGADVFADPDRAVLEQGLDRIAPVTVGDGAWLGQNVFVGPGVSIGAGAVVGANSVVTSDVPARGVAVGAPARVVRRL